MVDTEEFVRWRADADRAFDLAQRARAAGEHYAAPQPERALELARSVVAWIDDQWEQARAQSA